MSEDAVERAFRAFEKSIEEQRRRQKVRRSTDERLMARKAEQLFPVRRLLKKFDDMRLVVHNADRYVRPQTTDNFPPQPFRPYEAESSESWAPGVSLFFDHPAQVEIAIPNERDQARMGVVVMNSASEHPDQDMLRGPFRSIDDALLALSNFLAHNTVRTDALQPQTPREPEP
jgi:hypothetical protein